MHTTQIAQPERGALYEPGQLRGLSAEAAAHSTLLTLRTAVCYICVNLYPHTHVHAYDGRSNRATDQNNLTVAQLAQPERGALYEPGQLRGLSLPERGALYGSLPGALRGC